jgi:hypothetical protein
VKPWVIVVLIGIAILGIVYIYLHQEDFGLVRSSLSEPSESTTSGQTAILARPASIAWEHVNRLNEGFSVEMPSGSKQIEVMADNERGGTEPVQMLFSSPDGDTTYSLAWEDDPPVARVNAHAPDQTLDMARDDALSRTQTSLISENRDSREGFPGRDFQARNVNGGILNARLIYAQPRLYMLIAAFPAASARREADVTRFFNSFAVAPPNRIPERM